MSKKAIAVLHIFPSSNCAYTPNPLAEDSLSASEVVVALVAVVHLLSAGEPALELPDVTLVLLLLDEGHPPVDADEHCQTDHPLDGDPQQVDPTEQNKPQATLLAFNTGQLYMSAAALGTSLIVCHNNYLLLSLFVFYFSGFCFPFVFKGFWGLLRFYIFKKIFIFFSEAAEPELPAKQLQPPMQSW